MSAAVLDGIMLPCMLGFEDVQATCHVCRQIVVNLVPPTIDGTAAC